MRLCILLLLTVVAGPLHAFETESGTQQSDTDRKSAEVIKPIDSSKNSIAALKALGAKISWSYFFQSSLNIELEDREITDEIVRHLSNLESPSVSVTVPSANLSKLNGLKNIRLLSVGHPTITRHSSVSLACILRTQTSAMMGWQVAASMNLI